MNHRLEGQIQWWRNGSRSLVVPCRFRSSSRCWCFRGSSFHVQNSTSINVLTLRKCFGLVLLGLSSVRIRWRLQDLFEVTPSTSWQWSKFDSVLDLLRERETKHKQLCIVRDTLVSTFSTVFEFLANHFLNIEDLREFSSRWLSKILSLNPNIFWSTWF